MQQLESFACTVDRTVKWCNCYGKHFGGSSKIKNATWTSNLTSGYLPKDLKARNWRHTYTPTFQAALFMIANRWMDRQNVICYLQWILFSLEEEDTSATCYRTAESWKHYAKWNRPDTQNKYTAWLHLHEGSRGLSHRDRKESACL